MVPTRRARDAAALMRPQYGREMAPDRQGSNVRHLRCLSGWPIGCLVEQHRRQPMNIKLMLATTAVLGLAAPALAAAPSFEDVDTDGSGAISLSEVQAVAPEVTEADFETFDHDDDGALSQTEFEVWAMAQPEPGTEYDDTDEAEAIEDPQGR
jgi:hypothetical protein